MASTATTGKFYEIGDGAMGEFCSDWSKVLDIYTSCLTGTKVLKLLGGKNVFYIDEREVVKHHKSMFDI